MLNLDILFVVMSFCDRQTLATLIKTCKALYRAAARRIVARELFIRLKTEHDMAQFLRFMDADDGRRWTVVQGLYFGPYRIRADIAQAFASAVHRATNLERLDFVHAERTLQSHPDLPLALASLPGVKKLRLQWVDRCTQSMLLAMHWPLEHATLANPTHPLPRPGMDPAELLRNCRHTLRSVTLRDWMSYPTRDAGRFVYPELRRLSMTHTGSGYGRLYHTESWALSYPKLSEIDVWYPTGVYYYGRLHSQQDIAYFRLLRQTNRQAHLSQGTWERLQSFSKTGLVLLYTAGFPCEIEKVNTYITQKQELEFLCEAMADARPTILRLDFKTFKDVLETDGAWIGNCFRLPAMENLRRLEFDLDVDIQDGPSDLEAFFVSLMSSDPAERT